MHLLELSRDDCDQLIADFPEFARVLRKETARKWRQILQAAGRIEGADLAVLQPFTERASELLGRVLSVWGGGSRAPAFKRGGRQVTSTPLEVGSLRVDMHAILTVALLFRADGATVCDALAPQDAREEGRQVGPDALGQT